MVLIFFFKDKNKAATSSKGPKKITYDEVDFDADYDDTKKRPKISARAKCLRQKIQMARDRKSASSSIGTQLVLSLGSDWLLSIPSCSSVPNKDVRQLVTAELHLPPKCINFGFFNTKVNKF